MGGARLTSQVVENRRELEDDVRVLVEQLGGPAEIVRMPAEMRRDEARLRVLLEQIVALGDELLEGDVLVQVLAAIREERQLEPSLVVQGRAAGRTPAARPVWMMTGIFSRAAVSQSGASSGSLIFSRVPSFFNVSMPVCLKILNPMAPVA